MRDWPSLFVRFPDGAGPGLPDLVSASFDAESLAAVEERSDTEWLVSFRSEQARDDAACTLSTAFGSLGVRVEPAAVSDGDWARRSQDALGPIRVGRLLVVPPWLDSPAGGDPGTVRLVIEPSMGFGSGHHATTRLCLTALQSMSLSGARVLDIGTGSGILAIAAALLGAGSVLGVDNDPDALASARADAAMNGIERALAFDERDFRDGTLEPAGVVLANLTGSMLAAHAQAIRACVEPNGHLILSGITTAEAAMVTAAYTADMNLVWRGDEEGWVGLLLTAHGSRLTARG